MQEKSSALSKKVESIILGRTKDRLVDVVYRADNADDFAGIARDKLNYFYENLLFSALDLGVKKGQALDLGTQFGLCALALARQDYAFGITSMQDSVKLVALARRFAEKDMVEEKIRWLVGRQDALPFDDHTFDLVISGFDMHHWENPVAAFNEIERVTKTNGAILIADLRRDAFSAMAPIVKAISMLAKKGRLYDEMKHSFRASYSRSEVAELLGNSGLKNCETSKDAQFVYVTRRRESKKHVVVEFSRQ
jgi:ubiquinone/menaquinone biosynthesis C-methylase UbiE